MNFIDKIQQLINKESKKQKKEGNKRKSVELIVDISSDSDFENTLVHDVKIKKQRPVKRIINDHVKKNISEKKKIDLKIVSSNITSHLVKRRKRKIMKRKLTKKKVIVCNYKAENSYIYKERKNVIEESDLYQELLKKDDALLFYRINKMITSELLDSTISYFKRIDFKNFKIKDETNIIANEEVLHEEPDFDSISSNPDEEDEFKDFIRYIIERLILKIRGDEIIIQQREDVINDFVQRYLYWMDRSYQDERMINELKEELKKK